MKQWEEINLKKPILHKSKAAKFLSNILTDVITEDRIENYIPEIMIV